ncbi:MAG: hypothetical protein BIP78_1094 [Candidatus Bipolaricaulis sibiricus]|uniref:Ribokinase n=1 Tax=Bipolaricaulis sibiricus TaxID=2501609 RepID=A0A410FVD0_BIPS1|nr:MAG: hypothetical protein BIP78_1094 [Candidatus Bipolaricaulis sibiricus]
MRVAVLGTLDVHLRAEVDRLPRPGETVSSRGLVREPGGAGTLQAIAAARLGAEVSMYGCVGADPFGDEVVAALSAAGVNPSAVERSAAAPTGASLVFVGPNRHQLAAHAPGANAMLDGEYVTRHISRIRDADAVLLDLAAPLATLQAVLSALPRERPVVVLHPIAARPPSPLTWERVDFAVGSRDELEVQAGWTSGTTEDAARVSQAFLDRGVRNVVITLGIEGAYLVEQAGVTRFPPRAVPVVDATGATETFCAALAVKLAAGRGPYEALGYATAAAAVAASRRGGIASLPASADVQALLSRASSPSQPG